MTQKSKSSKSPRRDCLAAFEVKLGYELASVRVDRDPSVRVALAVAKSDHGRTLREVRSHALREANLNHGETAKSPAPVVNPKAP